MSPCVLLGIEAGPVLALRPSVHRVSLSTLPLASALLLGSAALASAQDTPWKPFAEVVRGSEAGRGIFTALLTSAKNGS